MHENVQFKIIHWTILINIRKNKYIYIKSLRNSNVIFIYLIT